MYPLHGSPPYSLVKKKKDPYAHELRMTQCTYLKHMNVHTHLHAHTLMHTHKHMHTHSCTHTQTHAHTLMVAIYNKLHST